MTATTPVLLHASCVAVKGRALLITGPSGTGKSALALQMMALGADLVADDQTLLQPRAGKLIATAPPAARLMSVGEPRRCSRMATVYAPNPMKAA